MHVDYGLVFYGFLILSGSVTVALCSDMGGYRRRARMVRRRKVGGITFLRILHWQFSYCRTSKPMAA